jgi:hypothetical protein
MYRYKLLTAQLMFLLDVYASVSPTNCDISIPVTLGTSATYILYSNGARAGPYGTSAHTGFQSENVPSILTLNLRPVRHDARRRVESGIPAACSLQMSPVVQTASCALNTSRNMANVYARSLNCEE